MLRILGLLSLVVLLVITGCSSQESASPTSVDRGDAGEIGWSVSIYQEQFRDLTEAQMLERVAELVQAMNPQPVEGGSLRDFDAVVRELGLEPGVSAEKRVPLPAPLTVASMAAGAINAINTGTTWPVLTSFIHFNGGFWGFQVSWLEDIPEDPNPNAYYCNYYLDTRLPNPPVPEYVDPYSSAVYDSAVRIVNALASPETCINRSYRSGGAWIYEYGFDYPQSTWYRHVVLSRFRLAIQE